MTAWRDRVWISATAAAAIVAVGFWWTRTDWRRDFPLTGDVAELCAAWMEREASLSYSPTQTFATAWVVLASETGPSSREAWGGYSNVTTSATTGSPITSRPLTSFHYSHRNYGTYRIGFLSGRGPVSLTAVRGFLEVYTNSTTAKLFDLGPSGGVAQYGADNVTIGGWAWWLGVLQRLYALPPNKHIRDAWWLQVCYNGYGALGQYGLPDANANSLGGIDPTRATYWTKRNYYLQTNTIPSLPLWSARYWGRWNGSGMYFEGWDFDEPNIFATAYLPSPDLYPLSPVLSLSPSASSYWANYQHPYADPIEDLYFGGWTNAAIPTLGGNANYVGYTNAWAQFVAGTNNTFWTTNALNSLAGWLAKQRVRIVNYEGGRYGSDRITFTNTFEYWMSRKSNYVHYQNTNLTQFVSDMNASYAGLLTDNAWYDDYGFNWGVVGDLGLVSGGNEADRESFGWGLHIKPVFNTGPVWYDCYWLITYRSVGGNISAELGWGQNTNGFDKIVAHGFLRDLGDGTTNCTFYVSESETAGVDLNTSFQHKLCALAFDIDGYDAGPVWVSDAVPAYTNVPVSGDLPIFTPLTTDGTNVLTAGWPKYKGWAASGPYVTFTPRWSTLTNHPAIEE